MHFCSVVFLGFISFIKQLGLEVTFLFCVLSYSLQLVTFLIVYTLSLKVRWLLTSKTGPPLVQVKTERRIMEGDPGKVICQESGRLEPAAVVMGCRGRGVVKR